MTKKLILVAVFFLLIDCVYAATVHGTIYDINLDKVNNARVEINTIPKQHYISKNGTYMFNVPVGKYTINAKYYKGKRLDSYVEENVSVKYKGDYVLDLILFPSFEEENELLNETNIDLPDEYFMEKSYERYYFLGFLVILVLIVLLVYLVRKKKPEEKVSEETETQELKKGDELEDVIKVIKEEGGRTTQKDIRRRIPLSEAKISLMISELEDKGIIKKIKKGRGNIIILNK
jgi:uncharacterized membrane protein